MTLHLRTSLIAFLQTLLLRLLRSRVLKKHPKLAFLSPKKPPLEQNTKREEKETHQINLIIIHPHPSPLLHQHRPSTPLQTRFTSFLHLISNGAIQHDFVGVWSEGEDFGWVVGPRGYFLPHALAEGADF